MDESTSKSAICDEICPKDGLDEGNVGLSEVYSVENQNLDNFPSKNGEKIMENEEKLDAEEAEHFATIVNAFRYYGRHARREISRKFG